MAKSENHAEPNSLLGMLQRGRGAGYLGVLSVDKATARNLLIECITNDPRLDGQVEDRADYYASLGIEIDLDLSPLAEHLRNHDDHDQSGWNTPLTVSTLGELAKRRFKNAAEILSDYVEWGEWWDWSLDELVSNGDEPFRERVAQRIESRFPTHEKLVDGLKWFDLEKEPWKSLVAQSPRLAKVSIERVKESKAEKAKKPLSPNYTALSIPQLLELVEERNRFVLRKVVAQKVKPSDLDFLVRSVQVDDWYASGVALAGLAALAPTCHSTLSDWAFNFWSDHPDVAPEIRLQLERIIANLPGELSLPIARPRLNHELQHERSLAEEIFEKHATDADAPLLRSAIVEALSDEEENLYRICNLTEAFKNLPGLGVVPELLAVFVQFRYSYGRARAAEAIQITSPAHFENELAFECLWDCEASTRSLAAKNVPLREMAARQRLTALASSEFESEEIRRTAGNRIQSA